jgi:peptide/nickel transport system permease protein
MAQSEVEGAMSLFVEPLEQVVPDDDVRTHRVWRQLLSRVSVWIAGSYILLIIVGSIAAPLIAPYGPEDSNLLLISQNPSWTHLLGTDDLGRDVLSRLLFGGQVTLLGAAEAVAVFVIVGVPLGLLAGYLGSRIDRLVMSAIDVVLSIPVIIILLVVGALFEGNLALMITLGLIASPGIVRVVRASTLAVRAELYVKAAEVTGLSRGQILRRHILPRIVGPAMVQVTVFSAAAIAIESTLGFLGLDSTPPAPSWGSMVAEGATQISNQPWLIIPSGLAIAFSVLAVGIVGDALRDVTTRGHAAPVRASILRRHHRRPMGTTSDGATFDALVIREDALVSVRDLVVSLDTPNGAQDMVDRVSFDLRRGEALGIVGESGSGKTLTVLALLDLLGDGLQISSGSVRYGGTELVGMSRRSRSELRGREIAFISQEPMLALDPGCTIGSQLREALRANRGLSRKAARERSIELLRRVELPRPDEVARRFPHELSGGMAQRVCIALALSGEPKLLIADEPTTALDVTVQAEILDLLRTLREETGMALILVSHDWGVIADSCDDNVVLYAGEVVENASVDELFAAPRHPYTEGLLAANPHLSSEGEFPSIPGGVPSPGEWPTGCRFAPRCRYVEADCLEGRVPLVSINETHVTRCLHSERVGELIVRGQ